MAGNNNKTRIFIYIAALALLAGLYGMKYLSGKKKNGGKSAPSASYSMSMIPSSKRNDTVRKEIKKLLLEKQRYEVRMQEEAMQKRYVKSLTKDFWLDKGSAPVNTIQLEIEQVSRKAGLKGTNIRPISNKPRDMGDHVQAVDIRVYFDCDVKQLAEFIREIDNHTPVLEWLSCSIKPKLKDNKTVTVNANIRGFIVKASAATFLAGDAK